MRSIFGRYLLYIGVFVVINFVLGNFLTSLGATGIVVLIAVCIVFSFVIELLNIPSGYRKQALKTPEFHRAFVINSISLIAINLIFNLLF